MSEADIARRKAEARAAARSARARARRDVGAALIGQFPASLAGVSPIAGYWPIGAEIDPRPLLAALAAGGAALALPRLAAADEAARFFAWSPGDPLAPDAFGVPAPRAEAPELTPRLVLAPLLAFDRAGNRLGQGAGVYDRTLAALKRRGVVAVGLAYAAQEVPAVPRDTWDEPLDWVVTEEGAIRCQTPAGGR